MALLNKFRDGKKKFMDGNYSVDKSVARSNEASAWN